MQCLLKQFGVVVVEDVLGTLEHMVMAMAAAGDAIAAVTEAAMVTEAVTVMAAAIVIEAMVLLRSAGAVVVGAKKLNMI